MKHIAWLCALGLLGGCGVSIYEIPTNPAPHEMQARTPDQVELLTAGPPQRPYTEVMVLRAYGSAPVADYYTQLRARAAALGCDAIVVRDAHEKGTVREATCLVYR